MSELIKEKSKKIVKKTKTIVSIDSSVETGMPFPGWKISKNKKSGKIKWDLANISLFLLSEQKKADNFVRASLLLEKFREERKKIIPLNAAVAFYLVAHQELIPKHWRKKTVFFWGTIYIAPNNQKMVLYLEWIGNQFILSYAWVEARFSRTEPAVILKKS